MRMHELYENKIPDGITQILYNVKYTWDSEKSRWLDPRGIQAGGAASVQLMKAMGRDSTGELLMTPKKSMLSRAQDAIDRKIGGSLSGGIDPEASVLGKAMGHVGAAIGRGLAKAIAPRKKV